MRKLFQAKTGHTEWFNEIYPTIATEVHELSPNASVEQDVLIAIWLDGEAEWRGVKPVVDRLWNSHRVQRRRDEYRPLPHAEPAEAVEDTVATRMLAAALLDKLDDGWREFAWLRWHEGWRQADLAGYYGTNQSTISRWEIECRTLLITDA